MVREVKIESSAELKETQSISASRIDEVLLGFEVGTGQPVHLSIHHLAIFGMTQKSGKTTALEALITRAGLKAIAFITKRGEAGFTKYNPVMPYYKPRADWQFVEGLVNVALGEKVKYEPGMRYAIMKVCKDRKDLREIQLASRELAKTDKTAFMRSVYEKLDQYLDIVIPELEKWSFSDTLSLVDGVNVMDLSGMRLETQHIVIASTIEYAFANLDHVIVIIPEAWETIPQGKMTPVKWVAQQFIRKGAALGNYLWLDSQDIGGIDKTPLRQCDNWLMGRMKEAHEVERIMKQLLGAKVSAEEIQTLALGQFYAAIGNEVRKVYVLPAGVPEPVGQAVALGQRTPESIRDEFLKFQVMDGDEMFRERCQQLEEEKKILLEANQKMEQDLKILLEQAQPFRKLEEQNAAFKQQMDQDKGIIEKLQSKVSQFEKVQEALFLLFGPLNTTSMPDSQTEMKMDLAHSQLVVSSKFLGERQFQFSTDTKEGQLMYCIVNELPKEGFTESDLLKKVIEHAWVVKQSTTNTTLGKWVSQGLLIREGKTYRLPQKVIFKAVNSNEHQTET
jgi:hypothetical protein